MPMQLDQLGTGCGDIDGRVHPERTSFESDVRIVVAEDAMSCRKDQQWRNQRARAALAVPILELNDHVAIASMASSLPP